MLSNTLPKTLKTLRIFEDFNEDYNTIYCIDMTPREWPRPPELVRTPSSEISEALARQSLQFDQFFASYMVDAEYFFQAVSPDWTWKTLTSISLTSRLLAEATNSTKVTHLLMHAGTVALQMPMLKNMDIWNGTKGNACAFRYEATDHHTLIKWNSTWSFELEPELIAVW